MSKQRKAVKLKINNLSAYYGNKLAIKIKSLKIPEGVITAFVGPSGVGKSTALTCLNLLLQEIPDTSIEGEILLLESDGTYTNILASGINSMVVMQRVGMIFQKANPFPMSIFDNVAYGITNTNNFSILSKMDIETIGLSSEEKIKLIVEYCLKKVGLWDEVKNDLNSKLGTQLSGGQQQRLCIARAIAMDPEIILMDEPTSALDEDNRDGIENLIRKLARDGITIVIVTHDLRQAKELAQYLVVFFARKEVDENQVEIRYGRIIESGSTIRLFQRPRNELIKRILRIKSS